MTQKKKSASEREETKGKVKVGKLKLTNEPVKDLTAGQQKQIKGGFIALEHQQSSAPRPTAGKGLESAGKGLEADDSPVKFEIQQ